MIKFEVIEVKSIYQGPSLTYLTNHFLHVTKATANVIKIIKGLLS